MNIASLIFPLLIIPGAFTGIHLVVNYNNHPKNINIFAIFHENSKNHHITYPMHENQILTEWKV